MATVNRFEDLEIWQLAFAQTQDFDILVETTPLSKDFGLKLYRCLNRKYITQEKFSELYSKNEILGKKIMSFIAYLQKTEFKGQRYKTTDQPQTSNFKLQT